MENQEHWQFLEHTDIVVSKNAQELWQLASNYFKWCDEHPLKNKRTILSGKQAGTKIDVESVRPYTWKGLCLHCGITEEYINDMRRPEMKDTAYQLVINRIRYVIETQNLEYALVGVFSPILTAKLIGVEDGDEDRSPVTVNIIGGSPKLQSSESEVIKKLEFKNEYLKKSVTEIEEVKDDKS